MDDLPGPASQAGELFEAGALVFNNYVIEECLGVGKSTTVYRCHHQNLAAQTLVLKVLHPHLVTDDVQSARFQKEIEASYTITHPHVIRAFEFIRMDGRLAYTMEYAAGGDLAAKLKAGIAPIEEAIRICFEICLGLQAIHKAGLIHRDLKPQNILFTEAGGVKIADFGLVHTRAGRKLTPEGEVLGAVDYVSPEYLETGKLDCRSDIYALGLICYRVVVGKTPFHGSSVMDALMKRLTVKPEPPVMFRKECPLVLNNLILRCLERDPQDRFQNTDAVLAELRLLHRYVEKAVAVKAATQAVEESMAGSRIAQTMAKIRTFAEFSIDRKTAHGKLITQVLTTLGAGLFAFCLTVLLIKISSTEQPKPQPVPAPPQAVVPAAAVEPRPVPAVPTQVPLPEPAAAAPGAPVGEEPAPELIDYYTVNQGDTLAVIAARFSVSVRDLVEENRVQPERLRIGTVLRIPKRR